MISPIFNPIRLDLPVLVVPKGRARATRKGVLYTPGKTLSFEAEIRWHWQASKHQMIPKVPTSVTISCWIPKPESLRKRKKNPVFLPVTKPDVDNAAKAIMDALNGFAWHDDNQVTDLQIYKRYTLGPPKVLLVIAPVVYGGEP